jgi:hypothetical protein
MWALLRLAGSEAPQLTVTTIGLDIAKAVFHVHGIDAEKVVIQRRFK